MGTRQAWIADVVRRLDNGLELSDSQTKGLSLIEATWHAAKAELVLADARVNLARSVLQECRIAMEADVPEHPGNDDADTIAAARARYAESLSALIRLTETQNEAEVRLTAAAAEMRVISGKIRPPSATSYHMRDYADESRDGVDDVDAPSLSELRSRLLSRRRQSPITREAAVPSVAVRDDVDTTATVVDIGAARGEPAARKRASPTAVHASLASSADRALSDQAHEVLGRLFSSSASLALAGTSLNSNRKRHLCDSEAPPASHRASDYPANSRSDMHAMLADDEDVTHASDDTGTDVAVEPIATPNLDFNDAQVDELRRTLVARLGQSNPKPQRSISSLQTASEIAAGLVSAAGSTTASIPSICAAVVGRMAPAASSDDCVLASFRHSTASAAAVTAVTALNSSRLRVASGVPFTHDASDRVGARTWSRPTSNTRPESTSGAQTLQPRPSAATRQRVLPAYVVQLSLPLDHDEQDSGVDGGAVMRVESHLRAAAAVPAPALAAVISADNMRCKTAEALAKTVSRVARDSKTSQAEAHVASADTMPPSLPSTAANERSQSAKKPRKSSTVTSIAAPVVVAENGAHRNTALPLDVQPARPFSSGEPLTGTASTKRDSTALTERSPLAHVPVVVPNPVTRMPPEIPFAILARWSEVAAVATPLLHEASALGRKSANDLEVAQWAATQSLADLVAAGKRAETIARNVDTCYLALNRASRVLHASKLKAEGLRAIAGKVYPSAAPSARRQHQHLGK